MFNKAFLKSMGIDVVASTIETLKESGQKFAQEIQCPVEDVQIRIEYTKGGNPFYKLYKIDRIQQKTLKIREPQLSEII